MMHARQAYNILRKSANLIINLFLLMSGANIPDISADPEKTILKLESKFVLDLVRMPMQCRCEGLGCSRVACAI